MVIFGVQNFEFQIFGGFQKNEYFFGYEDFVNIFGGGGGGGHHKIGLYLGVISMHFRVYLRSKYRMGEKFWAAKISNLFLGCLKFLIFFGVKGRCWARAYL